MNPIFIIGGGVIGLSIGWELARKGEKVILFEKEVVGSGASSAAAGMITPVSEVKFGEENLLRLFLASLEIYPSFVANLEKESGQTVDFNTNGSLAIAIDHDDEAELLRLHEYQKNLGLPVSLISREEALEKEPSLTQRFVSASFAPREYCLDNLKLIAALKRAFVSQKGQLFEKTPLLSVDVKDNHVQSVRTPKGSFPTERLILASGLQSHFDGLPDDFHLPLRPVKGQAFEVRMPLGLRLTHSVRTLHRYPVYLVPRSDGRLVIGATLEEMGFDREVTAGALLDLIYGAWKILPAIYEMPVAKTWGGLRPTTLDHAPIIGPTSVEGLYGALGMYRHGILLAPIVAQLMSELIAKKKDSEFFEIFGWGRFNSMNRESVIVNREKRATINDSQST